jgi:hypothetical protein
LPSLQDTARIDCLNELSFQYTRLLIRDSAEYFEYGAYKESEKLNYVHGIAEAVSNQSGIVEYFDNNFPKSETLANQSISYLKKQQIKKVLKKRTTIYSSQSFQESKFDEAFPVALWLYQKYKLNKDSSGMRNSLGGISVTFFKKVIRFGILFSTKKPWKFQLQVKTMWRYQMT